MIVLTNKIENLYFFLFCISFVTVKSKSEKKYRLFSRVEILHTIWLKTIQFILILIAPIISLMIAKFTI